MGGLKVRPSSVRLALLIAVTVVAAVILWPSSHDINAPLETRSPATATEPEERPTHRPREQPEKQLTCPSTVADKWVVVTSINPPTPTMLTLAKQTHWRVVVIGDVKSPPKQVWEGVGANTVFLTIEDQLALGLKTPALIPERAYTRKNIGYLYAVMCGAKVIYETDDDNELIYPQIEQGFSLGSTNGLHGQGPIWATYGDYRGPLLHDLFFNPYPHFGEPSLWPRGYPLDLIGATPPRRIPILSRHAQERAIIQQGLANGDPDVDAIFRLTRKRADKRVEVKFSDSSPPIQLGMGTYAPFNSQNTLFLYDSFAFLLIPTTVSFRACDIIRGYIAQRLAWEVGGRLSFHKPSVYQLRNAHNYMLDFLDEDMIYKDVTDFIHALDGFQSDTGALQEYIIELIEHLVKRKFLGERDLRIAKSFVADLEAIGYTFPPLARHTSPVAEAYPLNRKTAWPHGPSSDPSSCTSWDFSQCQTAPLPSVSPVAEPITAVIGILTHSSGIAYRTALRETTLKWLREHPEFSDIKFVFLMDAPLNNDVIDEAREHGDVYFLSSFERGRAVAFGKKLLGWLTQAAIDFPNSSLYGKIDDDVFLCLPNLANKLRALKSKRGLYYGHFHRGTDVAKPRADEQVVVFGRGLVEAISELPWPMTLGTRDTDFGGTTLGVVINDYLATHPQLLHGVEIERIDTHDHMVHDGTLRQRRADVFDFCSKGVVSYHPVKLPEDLHRLFEAQACYKYPKAEF